MKFTDQDGKEWETVGYTQEMPAYAHYITLSGHIKFAPNRMYTSNKYLQIRPVPKRHTFGGVVFEDTGEVRPAQVGEWYLFDGVPLPADFPMSGRTPILRPVALEG